MGDSKTISYYWMVKHTPQREWIEGKGIFLWLAFFFSEFGAGIYFVSFFLDFKNGFLVGWLVSLLLGGLLHLAYLGKPMRAWRILLRPYNSELSRGLWVVLLFGLFGFFQILPSLIVGLPWTGEGMALKVIVGIFCVLLIIHGFMTIGVIKAIPFWNSPMMVPLALCSGILLGSQTVELLLHIIGRDTGLAEIWSRWALIAYIAAIIIFLWGIYNFSETAKISLKKLWHGSVKNQICIALFITGLFIAVLITIKIWASGYGGNEKLSLFMRFLSVVLADLAMRYNIMRGALYSPLL